MSLIIVIKPFTQKLTAIFFVLFILIVPLNAQWVNNPAENTKVVIDASSPINISTTKDGQGGSFIFWEDKKSNANDIYFIRLDGNGKAATRTDGKKLSGLKSDKKNPQAVYSGFNSAVVVWKDISKKSLFAQKVSNMGTLMWTGNGVEITDPDKEIDEYSVDANTRGNVFVLYIEKPSALGRDYEVKIKKLNQNGKESFDSSGISIYKSQNRKSNPFVCSDKNGGAYAVWVENQNNKGIIYSQKIDSTGRLLWSQKPLIVSSASSDAVLYSARNTSSGLYIAWQVQKKSKEIHHQLISKQGKLQWTGADAGLISEKGSNSNPQAVVSDSSIILSWTNDFQNDKNILVQKFNMNGKPLWKNRVNVTNSGGDQFGQQLIDDSKGGAIITWIDRRISGVRANIYAQRILKDGSIDWDPKAIAAASFPNSEKSYQSIVSDERGSAIIIFKDQRNNKSGIYAQKIFNTGTYVAQIIGFKSETVNDSVKISWYSANEEASTFYNIERAPQSASDDENGWVTISTVESNGKSANYYSLNDKPTEAGTYYYRIVQRDDEGNIQLSDISRINFMETSSSIIVAQNNPNPFSDLTVIKFYLPKSSEVLVEFYNSSVVKMNEIPMRTYPAGENQVSFSAKGLTPGVYFYRITVGDFVEVKKMVITK